MNKTPKELTESPEKSHSENEGKKRLTQMIALVAFGASVGLTAQVNAAAPTAEKLKATKKIDAKDLKVKRNVETREIKNVETRKLKVKPKEIKPVETQIEPGIGTQRPPPP